MKIFYDLMRYMAAGLRFLQHAFRWPALAVLACSLALGACGGGGSEENDEDEGDEAVSVPSPITWASLSGIPDPTTVFDVIEVTYFYQNNLVNGIWHAPSNRIIAGHFDDPGYWSTPAGTGGYTADPDNDVTTSYDRMVHMPATDTVIHTNNNQFASTFDEIYIGAIDPVTGALGVFSVVTFSDGFVGNCNLISSSASEFLCFDGTVIRRYLTATGSSQLTFVDTVPLSVPPTDICDSFCFGGTFAWDGVYFYFAAEANSTGGSSYEVYDANGTLVDTYTAAGTGNINGTYFDWSVGRYATHDGFGTRTGGTEFIWAGGSTTDDSQSYGPVSNAHDEGIPVTKFLFTERNAGTVWEWTPVTGGTTVFHSVTTNDADCNALEGSALGWIVDHFGDTFSNFTPGTGTGVVSSFSTPYAYPKHVTVFNDNVFVMSRNDVTIHYYDQSGTEIDTIDVSAGNAGQGMATDGTFLYASVWDGTVSSIRQYDSNLNFQQTFANPTGMGGQDNMVDLVYDAAHGTFFGLATTGEAGTGTESNTVLEFDMGGTVMVTRTLPVMADGIGQSNCD